MSSATYTSSIPIKVRLTPKWICYISLLYNLSYAHRTSELMCSQFVLQHSINCLTFNCVQLWITFVTTAMLELRCDLPVPSVMMHESKLASNNYLVCLAEYSLLVLAFHCVENMPTLQQSKNIECTLLLQHSTWSGTLLCNVPGWSMK